MDIEFHCSEKENFKKRNQSVRAFSYREYSIEPHNHDFYEMNIVLGGTGTHRIENESFRVKRGDVFVIPPMTVHAYVQTEHLEVYHILLKKEFIRKNESESAKMPGYLKFMEIEPFLRQNCSDAMFLHLSSTQIAEIQREFAFVEEDGAFDEDNLRPLHEHTAWKIIYWLSYLLEEQTADGIMPGKSKYQSQIMDTLEYLNRHYSEKITVSRLAERVYLSRSTFLRWFSAFCGCSPTEYVNHYRAKKATDLLHISGISKTEVAHACGFYDLSHMEKCIRNCKSGTRSSRNAS